MTDDIFTKTLAPGAQNAGEVSGVFCLFSVHLALNSKCHHLHKSADDLIIAPGNPFSLNSLLIHLLYG